MSLLHFFLSQLAKAPCPVILGGMHGWTSTVTNISPPTPKALDLDKEGGRRGRPHQHSCQCQASLSILFESLARGNQAFSSSDSMMKPKYLAIATAGIHIAEARMRNAISALAHVGHGLIWAS